MKTLRLFVLLCIIFGFMANNANAQFRDDFNSSTLDPAWTVVQTWPGGTFRPGNWGTYLPGNHYSLTDNPGYLSYWLDPMTHPEGFLINYGTYWNVYPYDAGLEIHRTFSGDKWNFEAGGIFNLPQTNGRGFILRLYFGNGVEGTYYVQIYRGADVHWNGVFMNLSEKTGPGQDDYNVLTIYQPHGPWYYGDHIYPSPTPQYYRVERDGGVLTVYWSDDGAIWNTAWSYDLGTALDGLEQRVVITGICWFDPANSYADWDYISVESTLTPVGIDIKPGSNLNAINPTNKGVIPLAILTNNTFNATTVDPLSVEFGPNGAKEIHNKGHIEDADGDGDLDMVLHFDTQKTGIQCGDTKASLTGKTTSGQNITGTDAILTVGCSSKSKESIMQSEVNQQESYELYPNYPNPFNTETEIRFYLPEDNHVMLKIYNINGAEIRTLVNEQYVGGEHSIRWDGTDGNGNPVPKGFYLYQFKAGSFTKVEKMSIIR
jgi:hypothetical protein